MIGLDGKISNDLWNSQVIAYQNGIWVDPTGTRVVTGAGNVFYGKTLQFIQGGVFSSVPLAGTWYNNSFYGAFPGTNSSTIRIQRITINDVPNPMSTTVQGGGFDLNQIDGTDAKLFTVSEGVLAIVKRPGGMDILIFKDDSGPQLAYYQHAQDVFLPAIVRPGSPLQDDFSNPASGWPSGENAYVSYGYVNGQYFIRSKQAGYVYALLSPMPRAENYEMEVDIQDITPGDQYGVILDVIGDMDRFITFGYSKLRNRAIALTFDGSLLNLGYENYAYVPKTHINWYASSAQVVELKEVGACPAAAVVRR